MEDATRNWRAGRKSRRLTQGRGNQVHPRIQTCHKARRQEGQDVMMSRPSLRMVCFLVTSLMLMVSAARLPGTTSTKKKHHAASSASTGAKGYRKAPAQKGKAATGKSIRSRAHARVRYLAGARLDSAHKAALIEEIGTRLKEPAEKPIAYSSALDGFYAQLASHEAALKDGGAHTDTVRVLQFGDSHTAAD